MAQTPLTLLLTFTAPLLAVAQLTRWLQLHRFLLTLP
jgi:hypothetical protein